MLSRLNGGLFVPGVGPASPLLLTAAGGAGGGASSAEGAVLNGTGAADAATAVTSGGEAPMGFASFHVSTIVYAFLKKESKWCVDADPFVNNFSLSTRA